MNFWCRSQNHEALDHRLQLHATLGKSHDLVHRRAESQGGVGAKGIVGKDYIFPGTLYFQGISPFFLNWILD